MVSQLVGWLISLLLHFLLILILMKNDFSNISPMKCRPCCQCTNQDQQLSISIWCKTFFRTGTSVHCSWRFNELQIWHSPPQVQKDSGCQQNFRYTERYFKINHHCTHRLLVEFQIHKQAYDKSPQHKLPVSRTSFLQRGILRLIRTAHTDSQYNFRRTERFNRINHDSREMSPGPVSPAVSPGLESLSSCRFEVATYDSHSC